MTLEITQRARTYGYLIWSAKQEDEITRLLGDAPKVNVYLDKWFLGEKSVDRKYRRISLGYRYTRTIPETAKEFVVSKKRDGSLLIKCS